MIRMMQPSLIINSHDVGLDARLYNMWRVIHAREGATPSEIAAYVVQASLDAKQYTGRSLRNTIFNAHGYSGKVQIGGMGKPGISDSTLAAFAVLGRHNIGTVWFVSCAAAQTDSGRSMCQKLAIAAGTEVIAGEEAQEVTASQAVGLGIMLSKGGGVIDDFEGTVYKFQADGRMIKGIDPTKDVFNAY